MSRLWWHCCAALLLCMACGDRRFGATSTESNGDGEATGGGDEAWIYDDSCFAPLSAPGVVTDRCPSTQGSSSSGSRPGWCNLCTCNQACESNADCTASEGTATGVCADGQCILDCAGGETCPGGRVCVEWSPDDFRCLWASNDEFLCQDAEEVCLAETDEESCNAHLSPDGFGRCLWVTETPYLEDNCTPVGAPAGRCIYEVPSEGCGADQEACTDDGPRIYYTFDGEQTYGFTLIEDCEWEPASPGVPCAFPGDMPYPLACGCVCG